ncbi:AsmA family protein [Ohtaekwangia koreensis]|uniref:AsmA family protein n=1 Tax=Ohtaekwangia koreensis TaxID=688867 RepID=UPI0009A6E08F|nr:AsmA-like C-terminal region-containing protein [Ohtaekwangia koreensis]
MKTFKKILFYAGLTLAVLFVSLSISVFLFKDKIINQFVQEVNKSLNTPVTIGKMDVSWFEKFPQLSIVFTDVYVEDSQPGKYPLLTANTISFQLNPIEVWKGKYTIRGLQIRDSETSLKIDAHGNNNYTILKENKDKKQASSGTVSFELKNVSLQNTRVHYINIAATEDLMFTSENLVASIGTTNDVYNINAEGQLTSERINIGTGTYLANKSFMIETDLVYNDRERNILINPSTLKLRQSSFTVHGTYNWKNENLIDLVTEGENTDIQTIFSLLPESATKNLTKYQSKGDVYFKTKLKGEISKRRNPLFSIDFGFKDATIFHPEFKTRIEGASLEGSFASSEISDPRQATLVLKNIKGSLNGESFAANFILQNFSDPEVMCDFKGRVDAASVFDFYPVPEIRNVSGSLLADVSFEGRIGLLKKRATAQRVSTQGTVELQNISLLYGDDKVPLQNLKGSLQFSNNDLALSNVAGELGNSDFMLNGFFKNIITFLLFEDQPIGIETDLKSEFIDLNQLLAIGFGKPSANKEQEYNFSISRNINLNFNCDVKALQYKRFHGSDLKGDLLVKNEMAVSRNITLKSMGGDLKCSGIVDAKNRKAIDVVSTIRLNGIYVDSIFYVFENFQQDFIQDKHLKGQAHADVNMEMVLKPNLRLFPETLIADIGVVIKKGELNNFEPMQKLKRYIKDDGLSRLRFSDLKNEIHIENKTIYIPQMEVRTNVTSLKVSGTHTFDQHIDYRIITPLRQRGAADLEAKDAIGDDGSGQSKLYLKITGTTDDYRIQYDTEAVKKKIVNDLKNEVKELREAFKNKGTQKKKEVELEKDEYFEWDAEQPQ